MQRPCYWQLRLVVCAVVLTLALGMTASSRITASSSGNAPPLDLAELLIDVEDVHRSSEVVRRGTLSAHSLYAGSSSLDDVKRANVVGGSEILFELKEEPRARVLVQLYEFRSAEWAQSVLSTSAEPRPDLAPDGREDQIDADGSPVSVVQATRGRLTIALFVGSMDSQVASDSPEILDLRDELFTTQYRRLPQLDDLSSTVDSPVVAVGNEFAVFLGVGAGCLFIFVAAIGSISSVARDRGSRELARVMLAARKNLPSNDRAIDTVDHSSFTKQSGRRGLVWWTVRTIGLAVSLGLLLWWPGLSLWWALAIFAFLLLGIALTKAVLLRHRTNREDLRMSSKELLVVGLGTAGTALGFTGGVAMMSSGVAALWMGGGAGLLIIVPMTVMGISLMASSRAVSRFARRLIQPTIRRRIDQDNRRPILLLRSFSDDSLEVRSSATSDSFAESLAGEAYAHFEETVAWALWRSGPVLTVGQPGAVLQPLGAARDYYSDDDWQHAIIKRMDDAKLIAFVVGRSPSLHWEVTQIREMAYLAKSIFILPPVSNSELQLRLRVLWASLDLADGLMPRVEETKPILLAFDVSGTPTLHVARARTTDAYVAAIQAAATVAARQESSFLAAPAAVYRGAVNDAKDLLERFNPERQNRPRRTVASVLADVALRI